MFRDLRIVCVGGLFVALSVGGVAWAQQGQFEYAFRAAPELPAIDRVEPVVFQPDCIQNDGPPWPAGSDAPAGPPGAVVQGAYFCTLEQLDPCVSAGLIPNPDPPPAEILGPCTSGTPGAQSWQMSFTVSGCEALILAVTATQTDIAPESIEECEQGPGGEGGFDATELTSGPGNEGAVHAIVLSLKKGTTLDPSSINYKPATGPEGNPVTVCRFLVESAIPATVGDSCDMTLEYVDDLIGSGQRIENKVTQDGESVFPQTVEKTIRVTSTLSRQLPGDCNQDGFIDLSDAVCLNGFLFNGMPPVLPCGSPTRSPGNLAVFDGNGDGSIDLSDVIYQLLFLFRGGPPHVRGRDCFYTADCPDNSAGCL